MRTSMQFPLAVHVLLVFAGWPDYRITSDYMAESTGVNAVIIRNLYAKLRAAGFIETKSGRGKTSLIRDPKDITLWDIYMAVEADAADDPISFHPNPHPNCPVGGNFYELFEPKVEGMKKALEEELSKTTLQELKDQLFEQLTDEQKYLVPKNPANYTGPKELLNHN